MTRARPRTRVLICEDSRTFATALTRTLEHGGEIEVIGVRTTAESAIAAMEGAHVVLHLTEWREYRDIDVVAAGEVVAVKRIVDGRNALDGQRWRDAGWAYRALGRPQT